LKNSLPLPSSPGGEGKPIGNGFPPLRRDRARAGVTASAILIGLFAAALGSLFHALPSPPALPSYSEARRAYSASDSVLLDRRGEVLQELRADPTRRRLGWTALPDISPALREAVIAAEDKRFYSHSGIDYRALGGAIIGGLTSSALRGASTLSMQLASLLDRALQPGRGKRTFGQKWRQLLSARELERSWAKEEILEAYLNLVTFRGELQGISAAARGLFGKEPHGLDRAESLVLAALIPSPGASAGDLRKRALRLAESLGWGDAAGEVPAKTRQVFMGPLPRGPSSAPAPHLARQLLRGRPPGSAVRSSLDGETQRLALDRLAHHLLPLKAHNARDGAVLVAENRTGEVLAYVSFSGNPSSTAFVDGVRARRQAGSTLKPFLYGLALEERLLTAASLLEDSPLDIPVPGGVYHPRNYETQFQGPVQVRAALASSLNVPAVRVLSLVGVEGFLRRLRSLGFRGLDEPGDFYGPAVALGSADVSLLELVNAYRALANGGLWSELSFVPGGDGNPPAKRVFTGEAAFLVADILADREARSLTFGLENPLATRYWTAVKTGTSKDMRDNWCLGFSEKYTVGVWVGNFSGEPMWNVSGISGAAPVWVEVMNWLHRKEPSVPGLPPPGLVRARADVPGENFPGREEWFVAGTEPRRVEAPAGPSLRRILYPPAETVFALDPDIPQDRQRIFFILQNPGPGLTWVLDGQTFPARGKATPWQPEAGRHDLVLRDEEGRIIDSVRFAVRGMEEAKGGEEEIHDGLHPPPPF